MKKKNFKKISSLILSAWFLVSIVPSSVLAQANQSEVKIEQENISKSIETKRETTNVDVEKMDLKEAPNLNEIDFKETEIPSLTEEINEEKDFFAQKSNIENATENIDIGSYTEEKQKSKTRNYSNTIDTYNTNPNDAIYLPSDYFGLVLSDVADANDRWYSFESSGVNKIAIMFSQQASGNYDLLLYKLDGSTLNPVNISSSGSTSERISYMANQGVYFLRVMATEATTTPYNFNFIVDVISDFDSNESNDFPYEATSYSNKIDILASVDNPYDEDWYKINSVVSKSVNVKISNAPLGNHYAVFMYDSSFNSIGNFLVDGSTTRKVRLNAGEDYYIRVLSYTGTLADTDYRLMVLDDSYLPTGHYVSLYGDSLYIDGQKAQIDGKYMKHDYRDVPYPGTSWEIISNFGDLSFVGEPKAYSHTYFTDGIGTRTSPVVILEVIDGYYHAFNNRFFYFSHYFDTDPSRPLEDQTTIVDSIYIMVDLDTGKVVDNIFSMHYTTSLYGSVKYIEPIEIKW